MRLSEITAALLVAPLVAAHGGIAGGPKIFGLPPNDAAALRSRNVYSRHAVRAAKFAQDSKLQTRQGGADGRCGKEFGCASCAEGYCCSSAGYCGKGQDYCQAPDSQADYGPGADANKAPVGGTTRNIARPKVGTVLYGGEGIYACNTPGTVAITYDDGPYLYTNDVLDLFASYNAKATFFVTGININKGAIDEVPAWTTVIQRMHAEGHQVASHTWSHQDLSAITKEQRYEQMVKLEMSLSNILGFFPTYMRPPYSSCTAASGCEKDMADLGYHISYFDLDTDDYNNVTPDLIQNAKNNYANAINPSNPATTDFLAIAHDIHQQTAQNLTGYMLDLLTAKGYRAVTMGECMGDPVANWYRDGTGRVASSSAFTPPSCASTRASSASGSRTSSAAGATPTAVSQDSSCGPATGSTCLGFSEGECCSQYGWCGNTEGHCGTGCQAGFGKCGLASSSLSSSVASTSSRATSSSASKSSSASSTKASSSSSASSTKASSSSTKASSSSTKASSSSTRASSSSTKASSSSSASSTKSSSSSSASSTKTSSSSSVSSTKVSSTISVSSTKISSSSSIAASTSKSSSSVPSSSPSSSKASSSALASSSSTKASSAIPSTSSRAASSSSAPSSTPSRATSTDGKCGGTKGLTCLGFAEGECCSKNNWCGNTAAHCGTGCNPLFGKCTGTGSSSVPAASSSIKVASSAPAVASPSTVKSASASSVNQPASSTPKASSTVATSIRASSTSSSKPTGVISPNGSCGPSKGYNCIGYYEGECCSQYGYCGSSTAYCGTKCQPLYGKCN